MVLAGFFLCSCAFGWVVWVGGRVGCPSFQGAVGPFGLLVTACRLEGVGRGGCNARVSRLMKLYHTRVWMVCGQLIWRVWVVCEQIIHRFWQCVFRKQQAGGVLVSLAFKSAAAADLAGQGTCSVHKQLQPQFGQLG